MSATLFSVGKDSANVSLGLSLAGLVVKLLLKKEFLLSTKMATCHPTHMSMAIDSPQLSAAIAIITSQ
jgi:hypothetical protein